MNRVQAGVSIGQRRSVRPPPRGGGGYDIHGLRAVLAEVDVRICAAKATRASADNLPDAWSAEDEAEALNKRREGIVALISGLGYPVPGQTQTCEDLLWSPFMAPLVPPPPQRGVGPQPWIAPGEVGPPAPIRGPRMMGQASVQSSFPPSSAAALATLARSAADRAAELVAFFQTERTKAAEVGVEVIGLELSVILQSGALERVEDAATAASSSGSAVSVSAADMDALRRAEGLLAEAAVRIGARIDTAESAERAAAGNELVCYIGLAAAVGGLIAVLVS